MANTDKATNIEEAIAAFSAMALDQFNAAYRSAVATTLAPAPTDEEKELKKAQASAMSQMASSLQQLMQMQKLAASLSPPEDLGRKAIVQLMQDTQATAKAVYDHLTTHLELLGNATEGQRLQHLSALSNLLQALAKLAPLAVWAEPASTESSG